MKRNGDRRTALVTALVLGAVTLAVFWPLTRGEFINFDDPDFVSANPRVQRGLTWEGVAWAFRPGHGDYWRPLSWLSHMLDCDLHGLNAGGHHLTNLLFHAANAALLLLVLERLTGALGRSAFVAGLFALHPLHVESVAWVSERKDVLSTFFWLLALWAYARHVTSDKRQGSGADGGFRPRVAWRLGRYYGLAVFFFALGLMSKPMVVTLPGVLLLLDYWPLRRWVPGGGKRDDSNLRSLLVEKLPFVVLALVVSALTVWAQHRCGTLRSLDQLPLGDRLAHTAIGYLGYLEKTLWPVELSFLYVLPERWPAVRLVSAGLVLGAISVVAAWSWRRRPYLLMGWLWFLGTLLPVIGLVQVGNQAMADRYTYVPLIGLFLIIAWGAVDLTQRLRGRRVLLGVAGALVLTACALVTRWQLRHWRNSHTLFARALEVSPDNYTAHNNLGSVLAQEGRWDEAQAHYLAALRRHPEHAGALYNLGVLSALQGEPAQALDFFDRAIRQEPRFANPYGKRADVLVSQGKLTEAVADYRQALALRPDLVEALNNLAWILATHPDAQVRNGQEAVRLAERACELTGFQVPLFVGTLAAAYAEAGRFPEAIATAEQARSLAQAAGQDAVAARNAQLLELYRAGRAYREAAPAGSDR